MEFLEITGGKKLNGEIAVPGSSDAALAMLSAALLTDEKCIFENVPQTGKVETLLEILREIDAEVCREKNTVEISAAGVDSKKLKNCAAARNLKTAILLSGPLLARFGEVEIPREKSNPLILENKIFAPALETLGAEILQNDDEKFVAKFSRETFAHRRLLFSEASIVGTENTALFCAARADEAEIFFASADPRVRHFLEMLQEMGANISGIGTHFLKIRGRNKLRGGRFKIPADPIYAGFFTIAGIATGGNLKIKNVDHAALFPLYTALKKTGAEFEIEENLIKISPTRKKLEPVGKIHTAVFPGFPTDLQSPLGVLLTQCDGISKIFETLFPNRLVYLWELEKMGAKVEILNTHQAKIFGGKKLHAAEVSGWGFASEPAMILAGMIAEGKSLVFPDNFVENNFENFLENLQILGAEISQRN